jgi:hypothetical protein
MPTELVTKNQLVQTIEAFRCGCCISGREHDTFSFVNKCRALLPVPAP